MADRHQFEKAFRYIDSMYAAFPNPGIGDKWRKYDFKQKVTYLNGRLNGKRDDYRQSLVYADSMLTIIISNKAELTHKREYSIANFSKGDVLFELGNYEEAYQYFFKGKLLGEKLADTCDKADFVSRFALLNYRQGKFAEAANLFKEAYYKDLKCDLSFEKFAALQGDLDNAGMSFGRAGMSDSAEKYYRQALSYIDKHGRRFPFKEQFVLNAKGVVYGNLADIYIERGKIDSAEFLLKKSIEINSKKGDEKKNAQLVKLKLARLYLRSGRYQETRELLEQLRSSIDTLPDEEAELRWFKLKWDYLNSQQQAQKGSPYLKKYLALKDQADLKERKLVSSDAGREFTHISQQYELGILKNQNELSTVYLFVTIGFSVLTLLIIFTVWRSGNMVRKSNLKLTELNQQVNDQNINLRNTLHDLEQSQEENTQLMKVVAHDLRNPIGAIYSISGILLEEQESAEEQKKLIEMVRLSSLNSLELISDILIANTRPEELKKEEVDLSLLLKYCKELLQFRATEKKQDIVLQAQPLKAYVSREKIWRVVSNLITNAIKFSPEGSPIHIEMKETKGNILITVRDQGIGVPDSLKDRIFDMFSQSKRMGTSGEQPFGMGLSISKKIMLEHGGRIGFENNAERGATFFIELPLEPPAEEAVTSQETL